MKAPCVLCALMCVCATLGFNPIQTRTSTHLLTLYGTGRPAKAETEGNQAVLAAPRGRPRKTAVKLKTKSKSKAAKTRTGRLTEPLFASEIELDNYRDDALEFWVSEGFLALKDRERLIAMGEKSGSKTIWRNFTLLRAKVRGLEEALPPGLDAKKVITRIPRLLESKNVAALVQSKVKILKELIPNSDLSSLIDCYPRILLKDFKSGKRGIRPRLLSLRDAVPFADVSTVISAVPSLLGTDPSALEAQLEGIRMVLSNPELGGAIGIDRLDVGVLVARCPALLAVNVEATLVPRLREMRAALPGSDVVRLILGSPSLLLEGNAVGPMRSKVEAIQALLPKSDAARLVRRTPSLLNVRIEQFPYKLNDLQSALPGVDVKRLLGLHPELLLYSPSTIEMRAAALQRLFPTSSLSKLLLRAPDLLMHDIDTFIQPKINALARLLPGVDALELLRREPTIVCLDVTTGLKAKIETLKSFLPRNDVVLMIKKCPRLLTANVNVTTRARITALQWLLGPEADISRILRRKPDLLLSDVEGTIAKKMRKLQTLFPAADVKKMVERDSTLVLFDSESLAYKVSVWRSHCGDDLTGLDHMLENYPFLLTYGVGSSTARLDFLKHKRAEKEKRINIQQENMQIALQISPSTALSTLENDKHIVSFVSGQSSTKKGVAEVTNVMNTFNKGTIRSRAAWNGLREEPQIVLQEPEKFLAELESVAEEPQKVPVEVEVNVRDEDAMSPILLRRIVMTSKADFSTRHPDYIAWLEQELRELTRLEKMKMFSGFTKRVRPGTEPLLASGDATTLESAYGKVTRVLWERENKAKPKPAGEFELFVDDMKHYDRRMRALAARTRSGELLKLLPGLEDNAQTVIVKRPALLLLSPPVLSYRVDSLRSLLRGGDVAACVNACPELLLQDPNLVLKPRLTRLAAAFAPAPKALNVAAQMATKCPMLLLADMRGEVLPKRRLMVACCNDPAAVDLILRNDPSLLLVDYKTLARLEFTLQLHRVQAAKHAHEAETLDDLKGTLTLSQKVANVVRMAKAKDRETKAMSLPLRADMLPAILRASDEDFKDRHPEYVGWLRIRVEQLKTGPRITQNPSNPGRGTQKFIRTLNDSQDATVDRWGMLVGKAALFKHLPPPLSLSTGPMDELRLLFADLVADGRRIGPLLVRTKRLQRMLFGDDDVIVPGNPKEEAVLALDVFLDDVVRAAAKGEFDSKP